MSFEKKTWEDRLTEFPKRRTLTKTDSSTEVVEVSRNEGDVFQEGDKFSATNMNNLETRIDEAFDEVAEVVSKAVVPGAMMMFAGSTPPNGYLLCDGQAVSREDYADLFEAIGTTWGAGNGETTFNVPDMREVAPVGVGTTSRTLSTHDTFTLGQFKDDQFQSHTHSYTAGKVSSHVEGQGAYPDGNCYGPHFTFGTNAPNSGRSGTVTRGKRIGVNYIIKY